MGPKNFHRTLQSCFVLGQNVFIGKQLKRVLGEFLRPILSQILQLKVLGGLHVNDAEVLPL